jgi:phosphate transport system substrate-binding protein
MQLKPTRRLAFAAASAGLAAVSLSGCLIADKTPQTIAMAGSDTTQDVMATIAGAYNADAAYNTDPDLLVNIKSQEPTGVSVPGDAHCAAKTYSTPAGGGTLAPNGSGAGRDALRASINAGDACIDVARSSSGPRAVGQDLATFEYYAFAMDAVGWSSASSKAPANLTLSQLQGIYNCTFTNWSQVGGTAGAIERYWPQAGSGTRSFAQSDLLGFDPTTISGPSCPAVTLTQENTGETITTNGDAETAVVPYSAANWIAQARNTQLDQRSGQVIKSLNGQALVTFPGGVATPNTAGPIKESNVKLNNPVPAYPGIRYVFNVTDINVKAYPQVVRYVGFENRENVEPEYAMSSPLCSGTYASTLNSYGFAALDTTISARNIPGSTCRLYTPV